MENDNGLSSSPSKLRCLAEDRLRSKNNGAKPSLPNEESQRLIHELQVHQIELEMQNEELRQARDERQQMEALLGKYSDLYDFAPAGYFNLDHAGIIRAVNLTGAGMLGVARSLLISRCLDLFISAETRPAFHDILDKVFANETKETCEVVFQKEGHLPLFVQVEAVVSESREECRAVVIDITGRKRMEDALRESEQRVRLKLESILTPEGDIGNLNLADIIDVKAIQPLMDDFFRLAHIPMSLSDLEGNVLVCVGWQKICTRFHRKHPETSRYCIESDTQLSSGIPEGEFRFWTLDFCSDL
jgi:PAS domain S-box-containing protein